MNANDSYWLPNPKTRLEGYPTIIGCERCERTMRTRMVMQYVIDRTRGGRKETPAEPPRPRAREPGARRRGDAGRTATSTRSAPATGETEACRCCAAWDGHSDPDSVGTHIFEEFIEPGAAGRRAVGGAVLGRPTR